MPAFTQIFRLFLLCFLTGLINGYEGKKAPKSEQHRSTASEVIECNKFLSKDVFTVDSGDLTSIHVRQNIPGFLAIENAKTKNLRIKIDKTSMEEKDNKNIRSNHTLHRTDKGNILVLEIDYIAPDSPILRFVYIMLALGASFLVILGCCIAFYVRKKSHSGTEEIAYEINTERCSNGAGRKTKDSMAAPSALNPPDVTFRSDLEPLPELVEGQQEKSPRRPPKTENKPQPPPRTTPEAIYSTISRDRTSSLSGASLNSPKRNERENERETRRGGGGGAGRGGATLLSVTMATLLAVVYAKCLPGPQAHVVLYIPSVAKLENIKFFFNEDNVNEVDGSKWSFGNLTSIEIYDISDASSQQGKACDAPCGALATCEISTGSCVCQRGYKQRGTECVDINECLEKPLSCPGTATCQNTIGSFLCHCGYSFYGNRRGCTACSVGCPKNEFENKPCTTNGDRECEACSKCTGAFYQARPCAEGQNRHCIHVAHPLLISQSETTPVFLEGLKVDTSSNVFTENLHNTRNLETTYYVTDNTQASDFYWVRESGLQVNIGILDVQLIPTYNDVTHDSDNDYMLNNPNHSEDKKKFEKVTSMYCRHPIPEYYSITLEMSRDRTTAAKHITCKSADKNRSKCPAPYADGDKYLDRSLNKACHKMGTFPDALKQAANSVERPIKFHNRECRQAISRCDQCLRQTRCRIADHFGQRCCQIDCYTLKHCKLAASSECKNTPVECAMGDAYRYTIQPVFENIKNEFQCHIKRSKPKILYKLFFYMRLPERNFETPRVYKTVYSDSLDFNTAGTFVADYITVEHNIGFKLHDEFILKGAKIPGTPQLNQTVYSLKTEAEMSQKPVKIHRISHNIYVASTQFKSPFAYSTSSWVKGNQCDKKVGYFKHNQRHHRNDGQRVNVEIHNSQDPYRYFVKAASNPPYIRSSVPGNTSVLPWYFKDTGPHLMTDSSLNVSLVLTARGTIWNIHVRGRLSNCPGYLGVTINNRVDMEELFRYDSLIFCPPDFNFTFHVPNWGLRRDKTFDVHLSDAKKTFSVYLTHIKFEQAPVSSSPIRQPAPGQEMRVWAVVAVIGIASFVVLTLLTLAYIWVECTKTKLKSHFRAPTVAVDVNDSHCTQADPHSNGLCAATRALDHGQFIFVLSYVIIRLLYSLIFTFSVFFSVLLLFFHDDVSQLSRFTEVQKGQLNVTKGLSARVSEFGLREVREQNSRAARMRSSCSHYIGELFQDAHAQARNYSSMERTMTSSISHLMTERLEAKKAKYLQDVARFSEDYEKRVTANLAPVRSHYNRHLQQVYSSDWLQFPQLLFNRSEEASGVYHPSDKTGSAAILNTQAAMFASFLEIEEVEKARRWEKVFWQRLV